MVEIRPVVPDEADRLTEIAHASKRHWGYPEHWISSWSRDLTVDPAFISVNEVHAAILSGKPVAFYALIHKPRRCMELEHFWVTPECMGRGVGRALFRHAVETAANHGAASLDISSDPHTESFYEKMGARTVGRVDASMEGRERYLPRMRYDI